MKENKSLKQVKENNFFLLQKSRSFFKDTLQSFFLFPHFLKIDSSLNFKGLIDLFPFH